MDRCTGRRDITEILLNTALTLYNQYPLTLTQKQFFLDLTKFKTFANDKLNVAKIMISVFGRVGNIVGKAENACYQHFLLFPQCFKKASILGLLKLGIVW